MKIFASDLDGTLFFSDLEKGYKQKDIDAIKRFQAQSHLFGCCTGRALLGATPSFENLLDCDFYIASSGAVICDKHLNIIDHHPIPFETMKNIVEDYKGNVRIFIQTLRYYILTKGWPEDVFKYIETVDVLKDETIYGVCLITKDHQLLDQIEVELKEKYPEVVGYRNMDAIDVVNANCSKGIAVKKIKAFFKAEKSYGIGDSYNDIPLIQEADCGMTFHTSPKEVKQEADLLVDSIEEALNIIEKSSSF